MDARVDPAFHGQMLATWYSFGDGLFYPALVGLLGSVKLVYIVLQDGVYLGFVTWQEARDMAAAAQLVAGTPLRLVEEEMSTLHAQRSTLNAQRSALDESEVA